MQLAPFLRSKSQDLIEEVWTSDPNLKDRIDEERAVISGVRLLGTESENGYGYTDQARSDSAQLCEGAEVFIGHPDGPPSKLRPPLESWGNVRNIQKRSDGNYGDLHYIPEHSATPTLLSRIRRNLSIGLSPNQVGKVVSRHGKALVESVSRVRSVDLVLRPATNKNLFESTQEETTVAELLESLIADAPENSELLEAIAAHPVMGPAAMPVPEDAGQQLKPALLTALNALAETADEATIQKLIEDIMKSAKPADDPKEKALTEQVVELTEQVKTLAESNAKLQKQAQVRNLLESMGVSPVAIGFENVNLLEQQADEAAMRTVVDALPPAIKGAKPPVAKVQDLTESVTERKAPKSAAGLRAFLHGR